MLLSDRVWAVLPARMPGMAAFRAALHADLTQAEVLAVLEEMTAAGQVMRRHRHGVDVYYRSWRPPAAAAVQLPLPLEVT